MDGDGDPVCQLGPRLLERARSATSLPTFVVLADPVFESWLVASSESLGLDGLSYKSAKAEPVSAIKRALGSRKYVKPTWQPRLTERADPKLIAKRSPSFARAAERFQSLLTEL